MNLQFNKDYYGPYGMNYQFKKELEGIETRIEWSDQTKSGVYTNATSTIGELCNTSVPT